MEPNINIKTKFMKNKIKNKTRNKTRNKYTFLFEFLALSLLMLLVPVSVFTDITILENELSELSITEFLQEFFILVSAIVFYKLSLKQLESKGFFILISGLFTLMFIREGDYFLDMIAHGFWKFPALLILIITGYYALKNKKTILQPLLKYTNTRNFAYLLMGFLVIIVFSRVFGTGSLWREIMGEDYKHVYKTIIQEGLELFGYVFVFYGSLLVYFDKNR